MNEDDIVNEGGASKIIKKLAKSQNIKNLAKFKSLRNSIECKKNSVRFKISKEYTFLSSTTRLAYT